MFRSIEPEKIVRFESGKMFRSIEPEKIVRFDTRLIPKMFLDIKINFESQMLALFIQLCATVIFYCHLLLSLFWPEKLVTLYPSPDNVTTHITIFVQPVSPSNMIW